MCLIRVMISLVIFLIFFIELLQNHGLCLGVVNKDECTMTRIQEMSLNYHFSVEQEVGSSTYSFFGFNGSYSSQVGSSPLHPKLITKVEKLTVQNCNCRNRRSLEAASTL